VSHRSSDDRNGHVIFVLLTVEMSHQLTGSGEQYLQGQQNLSNRRDNSTFAVLDGNACDETAPCSSCDPTNNSYTVWPGPWLRLVEARR